MQHTFVLPASVIDDYLVVTKDIGIVRETKGRSIRPIKDFLALVCVVT